MGFSTHTPPGPTVTTAFVGSMFHIAFHCARRARGSLWTFGGGLKGASTAGVGVTEVYRINHDANELLSTWHLQIGHGHSSWQIMQDRWAISIGGLAFAAGNQPFAMRHVSVVDMQTGLTSASELLPVGAYDVEAVKIDDNRIFFCGGHVGAASPTAQAGVLEIGNGTMTLTPMAMMEPRVYSCAVGIGNNEVMIVGGMAKDYARNLVSVEVVNVDTLTTRHVGQLPRDARYHSIRRAGDRVLVIGGTTNQALGRGVAHGAVTAIDIASGAITPMPPLRVPRYHCHTAVVQHGGRSWLCVMGGQVNDNTPALEVEMYDFATGQSHIVGIMPSTLDHDRITVADGNRLIVTGGQRAETGASTNTRVTLTFPADAVCS